MLTEDETLTGEGVWVDLKLNMQCPAGEAPSDALSAMMAEMQRQMRPEAEAVIAEMQNAPLAETKQVYPTSRKVRLSNDGTCVYLRLEVSTTRAMSYPELMELVENIVESFVEYAQKLAQSLHAKTRTPAVKMLVGAAALAAFAALPGSDEPQLGDRA